jgi:hypothetical protein
VENVDFLVPKNLPSLYLPYQGRAGKRWVAGICSYRAPSISTESSFPEYLLPLDASNKEGDSILSFPHSTYNPYL